MYCGYYLTPLSRLNDSVGQASPFGEGRRFNANPNFMSSTSALIKFQTKKKLRPNFSASGGRQWVSLPPNPIIFSIIGTAAPETSMLPIKVNRIDRAAGAVASCYFVSHLLQFIFDCLRCAVAY